VAGTKIIMIEVHFNLVSHNFSGRDVANQENHLAIESSYRNPIRSQEVRYVIIRRYHCLDKKKKSHNDLILLKIGSLWRIHHMITYLQLFLRESVNKYSSERKIVPAS
jgi:hypothetical protein